MEGFETLDLTNRAVKQAVDLGADYADARAERTHSTTIRLTNEHFEQVVSGIDQGLGIRVLFKGAWGFSSTTSLKTREIKKVVKNAFKTAKAASRAAKEKVTIRPVKPMKDSTKVSTSQPVAKTGIDRKLKLLLHLSEVARGYSPKVIGVNIGYDDSGSQKATVTSDGTEILADVSRVYAAINAVAKEGQKITSCRERMGRIGGFELFDRVNADPVFELAAKRAVRLLEAKPAPSGRFTVVADPRLAGVFAHEAVGHGCEADAVISGESILAGRLNKKVGPDLVSILDDSTVKEGWGNEKYDDEGVPTRKRVLIEKGILKGYILNRESAAKLGMEPNGGARAQNFSHRPIVRMSNTHIANGSCSFEEMLEGINHGVYLRASRGGEVDPAKGTFQFNAEEACLIDHGELGAPLLDVSLSGLTLETLHSIDAVCKDLDWGTGFCGKGEQTVPAGTGSPHIRIKNALVGGRA